MHFVGCLLLTERSKRKDLMLFSSLFHKKRNGKTLMLTKTHSLPFPFLFSVQRCRPERSYVVLSAAERPAALALLRSKKRNGKTLMLTKTHSLPFPFLFFFVQRCHPEQQPVVLSAAEGPALTAILTERSEWKDLLHSLTFHRKRNGKTLMLSKTHSLPFPFLFLCPNVVTPSGSLSSFMSPRAAVERSDGRGRFLDSGPSDLRSE